MRFGTFQIKQTNKQKKEKKNNELSVTESF